jgi:hypothetical protein
MMGRDFIVVVGGMCFGIASIMLTVALTVRLISWLLGMPLQ